MDDRLRETLSAMMDDEADELSVRRLLSHSSQEDVRAQWQRWQRVRDVMHGSPMSGPAVDVSRGVRHALDGQSLESGSEPTLRHSVGAPAWTRALALASVTLGLGFVAGLEWRNQDAPGSQLSGTAEVFGEQRSLGDFTAEQKQKLAGYLLQHTRSAGDSVGWAPAGYARVVSHTDPNR